MVNVPQRRQVSVSIIEQSRLAADYLLHLLARDPAIHALILDDCSRFILGSSDPIFLIDNFALPLPATECLRRLGPRYPLARYLVIDKAQSSEETVRLLWSGVHGFLEHDAVARDLVDAVRAVAEGRVWARPEVLQIYVRLTAAASPHRPPGPVTLTLRETQIIELVRRRLTNKEVASALKIQESTVKFHLSNVFTKLQITHRHELLRKHETLGGWAETLA